MRSRYMKLIFVLQRLMAREDGQDLVEYALLIGIIAIAATATSSQLFILITTLFNGIAAKILSFF